MSKKAANAEAREILTWQKNAFELVCVSLSRFRHRDLINIRVHVRGANGTLIPTRKGISLDVRHLKKLSKAVKRLRAAVEDRS